MTFAEITALLQDRYSVSINTTNAQPYVTVQTADLVSICQFLRDDERLFFDQLACLTAIDNGPVMDTMDVFYNLTSIPYEHNLMLRVTISRQNSIGRTACLTNIKPFVAHRRLARTRSF